jgi:hypothetical protein
MKAESNIEVLKRNDNRGEEMTDWPWNPETEKLTQLVLRKIAENLPSYASDAIDSCLRAGDERDLLNYFFIYCYVVKDEYFEATVRSLRGSVRSEARKFAEEAFDLIDLLIQWVNTQSKASTAWPPNIYARWDTVVRKFDICVSSGEQQELPVEAVGNATLKSKIKDFFWTLYEKTLKVIVDAVMERLWPK